MKSNGQMVTLLVVAAILASACSSTTTTTSSPPPPAEPDAGEPDPGAPDPVVTPTADAAPPPAKKAKKGELVGAPMSKAESCDSVCGRIGTTCAAACGGSAGTTKFKNNSGGWDQQSIASCSEVITAPALAQDDVDSSKACCCMLLPLEEKMGDPKNPASCDEICADAGMACDTLGAKGRARYATPGGSPCTVDIQCSRTPPLDDRCGAGRGPLVEQSCPCR
ncbi:hypothetical protein BH11MYX4_BH11MYX4_50940 [soil metagenome]